MLDFTKLWDTKYLFGAGPAVMSRSDLVFFWGAVVLIVVAVVLKFIVLRNPQKSPKRYLLNRYFHASLTMGILISLWSGARFQNIPWIQTHILVLVLWLSFLVWLVFIMKYYWQNFRDHHSEWQ